MEVDMEELLDAYLKDIALCDIRPSGHLSADDDYSTSDYKRARRSDTLEQTL